MIIWHLNINSLKTSYEYLLDCIKYATKRPDIIGLCETNNVRGRALPMIPGYRVAHNDATIGARGTAIYTRQELEMRELPIRMQLETPRDRFTAITIQEYVIIEAYAPVNSEDADERENFYMDLETIADKLAEELPNHKHIIIGDLNAHVLGCHSNETNENGELLLRLCRNTNMTIVPLPGPTFIRGETKTTVDYILMDPGSRAELH